METRVFQAELKKMLKFDSALTENINMCFAAVDELFKESKNVISEDDLRGLQDTVLNLLKLQANYEYFKDLQPDLVKTVEEGQSNSISNFELPQTDLSTIQEHEKYKELLNMIKEGFTKKNVEIRETVVDEDLAFTESEHIPLDPITQTAVRNPVKNTNCGHTYDKDSILAYMKQKKNVMCPFAGCRNKTALNQKHFVVNLEVQRLIQRS